jgi:hypothetical protein
MNRDLVIMKMKEKRKKGNRIRYVYLREEDLW